MIKCSAKKIKEIILKALDFLNGCRKMTVKIPEAQGRGRRGRAGAPALCLHRSESWGHAPAGALLEGALPSMEGWVSGVEIIPKQFDNKWHTLVFSNSL